MLDTVFRIRTLIDITPTGVVRSNGTQDLERNQQRNYETVLQVLGLRTQPHILLPPTVIDIANGLASRWFGETYHQCSVHRVWEFYFRADRTDAYAIGDNKVGGLLQDFEQVPVVTGLTETARFILPIFHPYGAIKNVHITTHLNS